MDALISPYSGAGASNNSLKKPINPPDSRSNPDSANTQGSKDLVDAQTLKKMKEFAGDKTISQYISDDLKEKQLNIEKSIQNFDKFSANPILNSKNAHHQKLFDLNSPYIPSFLQQKNVF